MAPGPEQMVKVPLPEWVELIANHAATKAAQAVIEKHLELCEARKAVPEQAAEIKKQAEQIVSLKMRFIALMFYMLGAGTLGGLLGGFAGRLLRFF